LSAVQDRLRANRAKAANFDNALAAWRRANAALVKLDREGQATLYDRAVLAQYLRE
jgi:hypothetical protein